MNNFNAVFDIIKENCRQIGVPDASCYGKIVEILDKQEHSFPATMYLQVLHSLKMIHFSETTKDIFLTQKGADTTTLFDLNPPEA